MELGGIRWKYDGHKWKRVGNRWKCYGKEVEINRNV